MSQTTTITAIPHSERYYTAKANSAYVLPSDDVERERYGAPFFNARVAKQPPSLHLQHRVFKDAFDGNLIQAPIELKAGSRVLDLATGAGVWITDLDKAVQPDVVLHGIDIEPRLFPETTKSNTGITFSVGSGLDMPERWNNRFDLVYQRLMIAAWRAVEWPKAIEGMFRVLKPGGYVELSGMPVV